MPRAIESLSLTATPHGPRLQWMRPTTAVDGERLRDLAGFEIWRASGSDEGKFERIAVLVVDDRERFQQAKSFQYVDNHASSGHGYRYFVVAVSTDEYVSAPSNIVATEAEARGEAGNP